MADLVTVDQVNDALRLDLVKTTGSPIEYDDWRLPDVQEKISQASDAVLDYLKTPDSTWTPETAPPRVRAAVILLIGSLLDDTKADLLTGLAGGDLKNPVVALLYRSRDPSLA